MSAPPGGPRKRMRDLITIGQVWEYKKVPNDRVQVVQVHRADQQARVMDVNGKWSLIAFRDLKRYWRRMEDA